MVLFNFQPHNPGPGHEVPQPQHLPPVQPQQVPQPQPQQTVHLEAPPAAAVTHQIEAVQAAHVASAPSLPPAQPAAPQQPADTHNPQPQVNKTMVFTGENLNSR